MSITYHEARELQTGDPIALNYYPYIVWVVVTNERVVGRVALRPILGESKTTLDRTYQQLVTENFIVVRVTDKDCAKYGANWVNSKGFRQKALMGEGEEYAN